MREDERSMGIPPHWNLYISVENADAAAETAADLGGKVLMGAFDVMELGRMAVIQDPTGAVFCMWQAKETPGMRIHNQDDAFCWADLSTPDPERAKTFYGTLFGWRLTAGDKDTSGYLHIQNGEDYIGGIPPTTYRPPNTPPHWLIYFQVADVDATVSKAKSGGAQVYMGPMSMENVGRLAVMGDPQGAAFAVFKSARGA
jgi:predicted enzyme related to lactoylglutathione lyase